MSLIEGEDNHSSIKYFIPHHAVIKKDSLTTKLRVVFDASAKTTTGSSLNDIQYVGPTIQNDLWSILVRFRTHAFILTADVAKMYRQILIEENQRNLQLILWRSNRDEPVQTFRLNTITYGMAASSFIAIRCLHQLAVEYQAKYPKASKIIQNDFYVDDLLTGFNSIEEAITLQRQIVEILNSGHFALRKWLSNDASLLNKITTDNNLEKGKLDLSNSSSTKTLGIIWNPQQDSFGYATTKCNMKGSVTKRTILSSIAQIFDPLGLLAPIVVTAKIIMQKLWQCKLAWDESVPMDLHSKWLKYRESLNLLNEINVPRHVICKTYNHIELHGFSDASEQAYGACIYLKSINSAGKAQISLLSAKSRVAPLKPITIPRLELCGAVLLAELYEKVKQTLDINIDNSFLWCDSTIVLCWINAIPTKWTTFVSNRVSKIQTLTRIENWKHVRTHDNPADLVSRGIDLKSLINCTLWWQGPEWLKGEQANWPISPIQLGTVNVEQRKVVAVMTQNPSHFELFSRFSSLIKLQRVTAYCYRFIQNCRHRNNKVIGNLNTVELQDALHLLVKNVQNLFYQKEINQLKLDKSLDSKSNLLSLAPFLDSKQILRVGGRIQNSQYNYDKKHPMILPPSHSFTKLLLRHEHTRLMHCGPNLLLSSIRDRFWPIAGKTLAKRIVHDCLLCARFKPTPFYHIMGNLPKDRVVPTFPFYNCGVDYAGPILIKNKRGRGSRFDKAYICVIVCFATKAIHLELVSSLSTESFLAAFRRFIARRGRPSNMYSDNGTTFKGANNELLELGQFLKGNDNQREIQTSLLNESINWHFIPPSSPHFGGIWEAGVKSVKTCLKKVAHTTNFVFEEFTTLLAQIEAILNSRPLCPLSVDPNDLDPLTPSHFLIGRKLTSLPEEELQHISTSRLSKFQHLQQITQHFWKRWSRDYLHQLQVRTKWKKPTQQDIQVGDLVVIRDNNTPTMQWKLGRIVELHPGADDVVRVVTIKTASGIRKRAASQICKLPVRACE
ncbi:uncharacterized protein LOC112905148 [Agrilus planipennis]|uniref:Uncharacterized protein LOC112905148 n=1 Tax=Agrilus planipennis TaxID=224129 RepID=A0A7F5R9X2_AGRPL|nr:uncharacterized protein LOC112905148 [Agrilus planipennis]